MTFAQVIAQVRVFGSKIRRAVWPGQVSVEMHSPDGGGEAQLMIYREDDKLWHPWTVSQSDLEATDWSVVDVAVKPPTPGLVPTPGRIRQVAETMLAEAPPVPSPEPPDDGLDDSELV